MGTYNEGPNWGNLVAQGRAKAIGVPWNDEEIHAKNTLRIPADYVRRGCLTLEEFEEMKEKDAAEKEEKGEAPLASLKKGELLEIARKLGIDAQDSANKADLIELIEVAREKSAAENNENNDNG